MFVFRGRLLKYETFDVYRKLEDIGILIVHGRRGYREISCRERGPSLFRRGIMTVQAPRQLILHTHT